MVQERECSEHNGKGCQVDEVSGLYRGRSVVAEDAAGGGCCLKKTGILELCREAGVDDSRCLYHFS